MTRAPKQFQPQHEQNNLQPISYTLSQSHDLSNQNCSSEPFVNADPKHFTNENSNGKSKAQMNLHDTNQGIHSNQFSRTHPHNLEKSQSITSLNIHQNANVNANVNSNASSSTISRNEDADGFHSSQNLMKNQEAKLGSTKQNNLQKQCIEEIRCDNKSRLEDGFVQKRFHTSTNLNEKQEQSSIRSEKQDSLQSQSQTYIEVEIPRTQKFSHAIMSPLMFRDKKSVFTKSSPNSRVEVTNRDTISHMAPHQDRNKGPNTNQSPNSNIDELSGRRLIVADNHSRMFPNKLEPSHLQVDLTYKDCSLLTMSFKSSSQTPKEASSPNSISNSVSPSHPQLQPLSQPHAQTQSQPPIPKTRPTWIPRKPQSKTHVMTNSSIHNRKENAPSSPQTGTPPKIPPRPPPKRSHLESPRGDTLYVRNVNPTAQSTSLNNVEVHLRTSNKNEPSPDKIESSHKEISPKQERFNKNLEREVRNTNSAPQSMNNQNENHNIKKCKIHEDVEKSTKHQNHQTKSNVNLQTVSKNAQDSHLSQGSHQISLISDSCQPPPLPPRSNKPRLSTYISKNSGIVRLDTTMHCDNSNNEGYTIRITNNTTENNSISEPSQNQEIPSKQTTNCSPSRTTSIQATSDSKLELNPPIHSSVLHPRSTSNVTSGQSSLRVDTGNSFIAPVSPRGLSISSTTKTNSQQSQTSVLTMLLDALAAKFANPFDLTSNPKLQSKDFLQQSRFSIHNKELCKDYCPRVFQSLRFMSGVKEREFAESVRNRNYKILGKNLGKSGSLLFQTSDERYFIKTIDRHEKTFLVSTLPAYYHYMHHNPSSFLLKIFAMFRVRVNQLKCIHFIISKNVLPPKLQIKELYDLKGSTAGRARKESEFVRKDLDLKRTFKLGPIRNDVMKQLIGDSRYLESLRVMDYSLLVGVVEKKKVNLPNTTEDDQKQIHSLDDKPQEKRQSVSLTTMSNVLATSEILLESRSPNSPISNDNTSYKRMARGNPFTSLYQESSKENTTQLKSPLQGGQQSETTTRGTSSVSVSSTQLSSPTIRETHATSQSNPISPRTINTPRTPTTPNIQRGHVARLAMQFERTSSDQLLLEGQKRRMALSFSSQTSTGTISNNTSQNLERGHPTPQTLQRKNNNSTYLNQNSTLKSSSTNIIDHGSSTSTFTTSNATSSVNISQNSEFRTVKAPQRSYAPTSTQSVKKSSESSSKYSLAFLNLLQKEVVDDKEEMKHSNNPLTQLLNTISASVERFNVQKKSHESKSSNQLVSSSEFLQSVKSIQPKYVLSSNISEALQQRSSNELEGFKLVNTDNGKEAIEEIFFGIIDITQQFNAKKKAALVFRSMKYDPIEQSSVEPTLYASRFQKFIGNVLVE